MKTLNNEDVKNILGLIGRAQITGQEAVVVALLQQKLSEMLQPETPSVEEKKK